MSQISLKKKSAKIEGQLHPIISTVKCRRLELDRIIEGWDLPSCMPIPNDHLLMRILVSALLSDAMVNCASECVGRTEFDSHVNMCVLRKNCYTVSKSVDVGAFTKSTGGLNRVLVVDAILADDCKRTNQVYLVILRNVYILRA